MIGPLLLAAALAGQPGAIGFTGDDRELRCAAAFAIVGNEQARGVASALRYPAMAGAGREFFVRAMTARMDRDGLDREAAAAIARGHVEALQEESMASADPGGFVAGVMDQCLPLLLLVPEAGE